ncbi:MAG: RNA polymerase sigma factor [Rubrivivax sp.]
MSDADGPNDLDVARRRREAQWIADIGAGGRLRDAALEKLFHAYERRVAGWLRYRFRLSPHEAEDLWQDVLVAICKSAATFQAGTDARAWIYKVAENKALDLLKRSSRRHEVADDDGRIDADGGSGSFIDRAAVPPGTPDLDRCVRQGFARFARDHPEMAHWIVMADIEEHDIPDIAVALNRTAGATRTYLKTLRDKFRPYIAPCLELLPV